MPQPSSVYRRKWFQWCFSLSVFDFPSSLSSPPVGKCLWIWAESHKTLTYVHVVFWCSPLLVEISTVFYMATKSNDIYNNVGKVYLHQWPFQDSATHSKTWLLMFCHPCKPTFLPRLHFCLSDSGGIPSAPAENISSCYPDKICRYRSHYITSCKWCSHVCILGVQLLSDWDLVDCLAPLDGAEGNLMSENGGIGIFFFQGHF